MYFEVDFAAGDIQRQSELLSFSSNACTTRTPPAFAPGQSNQQELLADNFPLLPTYATGMRSDRIPHSRVSKRASQKNRTTLAPPPVPPTTGPQTSSQKKNRDREYQLRKRLPERKKKDLSNADAIEAISLITANATSPSNLASCRPKKFKGPPPCACPLCPRRFQRCDLIRHL